MSSPGSSGSATRRKRTATVQKVDDREAAARQPNEGRRGREKGDAAEERGLDELDRHRLVAPVVETVKRREEENLGEEREPKAPA